MKGVCARRFVWGFLNLLIFVLKLEEITREIYDISSPMVWVSALS